MTYIEELFCLKGRTAVITGGYGHLGRAMCWVLAAAGARVYCAGPSKERFCENFPPGILDTIAMQYPEMGMADICYLPFDLSSPASHTEALNQIHKQTGGLDILVNNAFFLSPVGPDGKSDFRQDMEGLLHSSVAFTEKAYPMLQGSGQGRIINIASMYGMLAPDPQLYRSWPLQRSRASYNAAKAALVQLSKYWASFWGAETPQLTVNAISPGTFPQAEVAGRDQTRPSFHQELASRTVLGRIGKPEDLNGVLLLLASRAGSYITGQNLVVDGGWTVR